MLDLKENKPGEKTEFDHLIKLLDDEDQTIYSSVKNRFISFGEDSSRFLRKYLGDENTLIKKRANEIVSIINFDKIKKQFSKLLSNENDEILEDGMFLLSTFEYPGMRINEYRRKLDKMSLEIEAMLIKIKSTSRKSTR